MEEVWKDLNTVSSQPNTTIAAARPPLHWLSHQEILAGPWKKDAAITEVPPADDKTETPFLHYALKTTTTDSCACSSRKLRGSPNYENTRDQKRKRLIKNRESAARSRARRQAYTYELEAEVAHLMEENSKLRKQQEKLCVAAVNHHHPEKKHKLYRTLTAPF